MPHLSSGEYGGAVCGLYELLRLFHCQLVNHREVRAARDALPRVPEQRVQMLLVMNGVDSELPQDRLAIGVLIVSLRRQRMTFRNADLVLAVRATVNASVRRSRSRLMQGVKRLMSAYADKILVLIEGHHFSPKSYPLTFSKLLERAPRLVKMHWRFDCL